MSVIQVNTPYGPLEFKIAGDRPTLQEQLKIKDALADSKKFFKSDDLSIKTEQIETKQLFDTETGIKDAGLRAALSGAENNSEQEKILGKFNLSADDYTRDKRNRLALTPTGAKKFGVETDKNVLIDESGFSRYDFADLAGILPELTGAVGAGLKGAAIGTAVAPGIGTLLFGAAGAALGGGGGSLAEEAIEGLAGVSDQTAKEIIKDAGKEAAIAGGAELLFGAPFLIFRGLAPKAGILKEGPESEAVQTAQKAVGMGFEPSGRQLQTSPIAQKVQSLSESVLGTSPRLLANRRAMDNKVSEYQTLINDLMQKSGSQNAGDLIVNLSKTDLNKLQSLQNQSHEAIIKSVKDSSESLAGSLRTNSTIGDDLYDSVSQSLNNFDQEASRIFNTIDNVLYNNIGTENILPTNSLFEIRDDILTRFANKKVENLGNSPQDLAYKYLVESFDPNNMGRKTSFNKLYEVRKSLFNILNGDSRNTVPEVVEVVKNSSTVRNFYEKSKDEIDKLLKDTNIVELSKSIKSNKAIGDEGYESILAASKQIPRAREFYVKGIKEFESIASSMGSKSIINEIRAGNRPEGLASFAMNIVKNDDIKPLINLKESLKNDELYSSLKEQIGQEWIRNTLRNTGFDSVDNNIFKPSVFMKALDDLGKTGDELFGQANYKKYKNIAKGFDDIVYSDINEELISKAIQNSLDQSVIGILKNSLKTSKELGELQQNKILKEIKRDKLTPDEAAKLITNNKIKINDLKFIINKFKDKNPQGLASIQKYYAEQMFDGLGATVNAKTLSDMSKKIKKLDGEFNKLDIVFDKETAKGMRDFAQVLEFISKDIGNSDLVANSITANVMGSLGKIFRIGIMGQLVTNKRALQQIKDIDSATKKLPNEKRGRILADTIGGLIRQFTAQSIDSGVEETVDQTSSLIKNTLGNNLQDSITNLNNQINQSQNMSSNIFDQIPKQNIQQNNIRQRAATNPAVAASLLGGLGSASLLD